jgi:hypothetical protein
MFDVLALVVLACEIVGAFALAVTVEPELIRPGLCLQCDSDMTVMRSCDVDRLLLLDV